MRLSVVPALFFALLLAGCANTMAPPTVIHSARSMEEEAACITNLFNTRLELVRSTPIRNGVEIASVDQAGLIVARVEVTRTGDGSRVTLEVREFASLFYHDLVRRCAGTR